MASNKKSKPKTAEETSIGSKILKWGGMITLAGGIFTAGYQAGCYISDIKCNVQSIQAIGEFLREREELKAEIERYKLSNINYATKEDLAELKKNIDEFYSRHNEIE